MSLYHPKKRWQFQCTTKQEALHHLKTTKRYHGARIVATNLAFDWLALFHKEPEEQAFIQPLWQGTRLLFTKTFIKNSEFHPTYQKKGKHSSSIEFCDTLTQLPLSVKNIGKLLNIPKLVQPKAFMKIPKNKKQQDELLRYNMRDAELSYRGYQFALQTVQELGGYPEKTLPMTALGLLERCFLKQRIFRQQPEPIIEQLQGFYGGRTEAFSRGEFYNYHCYDVNSMYPYAMTKELPNPNTMYKTDFTKKKYIFEYEGISFVDIITPTDMKYPLLPYRTKEKLLFPLGGFSGWYTHIELRKAIELGYHITKIRRTYYYKQTKPFLKEYVDTLYALRLEYKKNKDPREAVVKLHLNSLYGKFVQRFYDRDIIVPSVLREDQLSAYDDIERIGNYFRLKTYISHPRYFCQPIWGAYITAIGRLKLWSYFSRAEPLYVDTDSLFTQYELPSSTQLGELKHEYTAKKIMIIKPKMYGVQTREASWVKVKGCHKEIYDPKNQHIVIDSKVIPFTYDYFTHDFLFNPCVSYPKLTTFRESIRRKLPVLGTQIITKTFDLNDTKRSWDRPFGGIAQQYSQPRELYETPTYMLNKVSELKQLVQTL